MTCKQLWVNLNFFVDILLSNHLICKVYLYIYMFIYFLMIIFHHEANI